MSRFLHMQCLSSSIAYPRWAKRWVNIRKVFCNAYHVQRAGVSTMLEILGLAFEGRPHSGIDDARNIARILAQLIADGCNVYENEKLLLSSPAATDDALAAEVAVLQAAETEDDDDDGQHSSNEEHVDEAHDQPILNDTVNCADLLEHLSL